ncbi:hypothetical protein H6P81_020013 [Aristolochia fimbriata]|uniref:MYND-type domain-containing protein n=1 Tax=Aristolochia fimbriata TaxID=158543 RepID=A0AAV7DXY0_ARIFI|nr:hypothetical protein H6P81_020013 [Aristolochia fimbriata]
MDCSAVGCGRPGSRRCGICGAVAYCSRSHQVSHWNDHEKECRRLEQQMKRVDVLNDFPFTFTVEATQQICEKLLTRCSFLMRRGLHEIGMWKLECGCMPLLSSADHSRVYNDWDLPSIMCPCSEPKSPMPKCLSWNDYYNWRCLPLHSPVALLLHWPLTIYESIQLSRIVVPTSDVHCRFHILYLGPDKELLQLGIFQELQALLCCPVHIDFVGPAVPQYRDGEKIDTNGYAHCSDAGCSCKLPNNGTSRLTMQLWKGLYHERHKDVVKDSFPHLIVAPNAGIAAYTSWLPTIELIRMMDVPSIFSDYCEEAALLAANCIGQVTGQSLRYPIQLNPFRQPLAVADSALYLPCYSNCFLFGM